MKHYLYAATLLWLLTCYACKTDPLATLPAFSFRLYDSLTIVNSNSFPTDSPIVLFHFESDCRDCQQTTDSLLHNIQAIKNVKFYMLSMEGFDNVNLFRKYYHLDKYSNIIVGQDYYNFFHKHFHAYSTPFLALYNSNKRLAGIYDGKPAVKDLIHAIQELN